MLPMKITKKYLKFYKNISRLRQSYAKQPELLGEVHYLSTKTVELITSVNRLAKYISA